MKKEFVVNRERQQIKGVFVFQSIEEMEGQAPTLMKDLNCTVLKSHQTRVFVRTSRSNLHSIKNRWGTENENDPMSLKLKRLITQIIIGGNA